MGFADVLPTLTDAAGVAIPEDLQVDGVSLMPLFAGQAIRRIEAASSRRIEMHPRVFDLRSRTLCGGPDKFGKNAEKWTKNRRDGSVLVRGALRLLPVTRYPLISWDPATLD